MKSGVKEYREAYFRTAEEDHSFRGCCVCFIEQPRSLRFMSFLPFFLKMCRFEWSEVTKCGNSSHMRKESGNIREKLAATIFQQDNGAGKANCGTFTLVYTDTHMRT